MNAHNSLRGNSQTYLSAQIAECETSYDLLRFAKDFALSRGFEYVGIIRLPNREDERLSDLSIVMNWPPELLSTYDQLALMPNSPVLQTLLRSTLPLSWSIHELRHSEDPEVRNAIVDLFASFGLERGICFSTHAPCGRRGAVSFTGRRELPDEAEQMELGYVANLLFERAFAITLPAGPTDLVLSARERECLQWTAAGKTSSEISSILKLSGHTVNHYLSAACQKLGAMNRTHAACKALREGLID